jgi:hypothetical protein
MKFEELQELVARIVADGEASFKDFTPRVNKRCEDGEFCDDRIFPMIKAFGDDAAALVYALASNDQLIELIEDMTTSEAIAFIKENADKIIDSLGDDDMSFKAWERRREKQRARGVGLSEQQRYERQRKAWAK